MIKEIASLVAANMYNKIMQTLPEKIKFISEHCYIAGGSLVSILNQDKINDIDIYFKNEEVMKRFQKEIKSMYNFRELINCHEMQVSLDDEIYKVQFVTKFAAPPEEMIETFDFMHCKVAHDPNKPSLIFGKYKDKNYQSVDFFIKEKQLSINANCKYPLRAIDRIVKFARRGFKADKDLVIDLLVEINKLNLLDENVLADQTRGLYGTEVDTKKLSKKLHGSKFNSKMDSILSEDK